MPIPRSPAMTKASRQIRNIAFHCASCGDSPSGEQVQPKRYPTNYLFALQAASSVDSEIPTVLRVANTASTASLASTFN